MGVLVDLARKRLTAWKDANPDLGQRPLAAAVGHGQSWVSNYFGGSQQANIDELAAMAATFGHTLYELLDVPDSNDLERELIEQFRALPIPARKAVVTLLPHMAAERPRPGKRSRRAG